MLYNSSKKDRFEGYFRNGNKSGEGIYYYESGEYEYAQYYKGTKHGKSYEFTNEKTVIIRNYRKGLERLPQYKYNCILD